MKTVRITWRRVLPLCVLLFLVMSMIRNAIDDKSHDTHDRIVRNSRYFTIKEKISFNEDGAPGNFESEKETPGLGPGESGRPHHLEENQQTEEERLKGIIISLWLLFFITFYYFKYSLGVITPFHKFSSALHIIFQLAIQILLF